MAAYNSSSVFEDNRPPMSPIQIMRLVLYAVIFVCGLIGNVLVIVVVKCRGKKRTFHDYFLLNLAIADLLFILCLPADIYIEVAVFPFTEFYCKILYPLTTFAFSLSIFTLSSMAVGRCYVMKNTSKPPLKGRAAMLWILLLWIASFACVLPLTIVARSSSRSCREDWPDPIYRKAFTASLLLLQYIGPLVIIALAYVNIGILLAKNKVPQTNSNSSKSHSLLHRIRHRNLQITRTLAVIVVLFALLMLPHEIAWMLLDFGPDPNSKLADTLIKFSPILTYLHSCSNPLVYGLMTTQFRNDVRKYVYCCRRYQGSYESETEHKASSGKLLKHKKRRKKCDKGRLGEHVIADAISTSHAVGYGGKVNVIVYLAPSDKRVKLNNNGPLKQNGSLQVYNKSHQGICSETSCAEKPKIVIKVSENGDEAGNNKGKTFKDEENSGTSMGSSKLSKEDQTVDTSSIKLEFDESR
ncbi:somatostatin receptor type 5 [Nematostella vectensis]|uniref:somatostatin receptor type 5 n=1 Tax=Nematostella vectensis TaxID=45351 RepID=UPI002077008D|nr:somatostatin receptor type 5 [Nematostella vectensis]